jgi:hypothetical protein
MVMFAVRVKISSVNGQHSAPYRIAWPRPRSAGRRRRSRSARRAFGAGGRTAWLGRRRRHDRLATEGTCSKAHTAAPEHRPNNLQSRPPRRRAVGERRPEPERKARWKTRNVGRGGGSGCGEGGVFGGAGSPGFGTGSGFGCGSGCGRRSRVWYTTSDLCMLLTVLVALRLSISSIAHSWWFAAQCLRYHLVSILHVRCHVTKTQGASATGGGESSSPVTLKTANSI